MPDAPRKRFRFSLVTLVMISETDGPYYLYWRVTRMHKKHWRDVPRRGEFWLTLAIGIGLLWSVWRDRKAMRVAA